MNVLVFSILILVYVGTCYAGVRGYWWTRSRIAMLRAGRAKQVALEYGTWIVFVSVLIPFGIFIPLWLSETMNVVDRSQVVSMGLILFGCAVLAGSAYLGRRKGEIR